MDRLKTIVFYILLGLFLISLAFSAAKFIDFPKPLNIIIDSNYKNEDDVLLRVDKKLYTIAKFKNIHNFSIQNRVKDIDILINKNQSIDNIVIYNDIKLFYINDFSLLPEKEEEICSTENCKNYYSYKLSEKIKNDFKYINSSSKFESIIKAVKSFFEFNNNYLLSYLLLFFLIIFFINFKISSNFSFIIIVILAFLLRVVNITQVAPWGDEYFALDAANPDKPFLYTFKDPGNPPFYFIILRLFILLFGSNYIYARFLSVVFSLLAVIVLWIFLKKNFNLKIANIASFLLSINIYLIYYAQEIRCYSLLVLLSILSGIFLYEILEKNKIKDYLIYALIITMLVNTHYFGVLYAIGNFFFGCFVLIKEKRYRDILKLLSVSLIALLFFLPYFIHTGFKNALLDEYFNIHFQKITYSLIKEVVFFIFGGLMSFLPSIFFFVKNRNPIINYCFFMIVFLVLSSLILSFLIRPLIVPRYFIVLIPVFCVFVSFVLNNFNKKYSILFLIIWMFFIQNYDSKTLVDIRRRCMTSNNTFFLAFNQIKGIKEENLYFILRPSDTFFVNILTREKLKKANYYFIKQLLTNEDTESFIKEKISEIQSENKNALIYTPLLKSSEENSKLDDSYTCYFNTALDMCVWKIRIK